MAAVSEYNGVVIVDKPAGMTSHDVVYAARKLFRTKRVGHTGTLDPDATGVLVLCLGVATRLAEYLSAARKNYLAEIVFGIETDTQDASGQILAERNATHLTQADILALLPRFRGTIQQIPPMVSALHHEGKRLYELAREGITVEREARSIQIDHLELLDFQPGVHPIARLEITCSTGTYIRVLASDLGAGAQVGGMMQSLRRTWVGEPGQAFTLEEAHTLDELRERAGANRLQEVVLPSASALRSWPAALLTPEQTLRVQQGQQVALAELEASADDWPQREENTLVAMLDAQNNLLAVAQKRGLHLQPVKVLTG